jgi:hypothetical protein
MLPAVQDTKEFVKKTSSKPFNVPQKAHAVYYLIIYALSGLRPGANFAPIPTIFSAVEGAKLMKRSTQFLHIFVEPFDSWM